MSGLVHQRCVAHAAREAAARCPSCRMFYCRECVTEHDGRVLCVSCLSKQAEPPRRARLPLGRALVPVQLGLGLGLAWAAFYLLGMVLLQTPSEWHEGKAAESWLMQFPQATP